MATSKRGERYVALEVRASITERPSELGAIVAYAFSQGGALLDMQALDKFEDYSRARDRMLAETSTEHAPWRVVLNNDKQRGRLNFIRSVLHAIAYERKDTEEIGAVDEKIVMSPETFAKRHPEM